MSLLGVAIVVNESGEVWFSKFGNQLCFASFHETTLCPLCDHLDASVGVTFLFLLH